MTLSGSCPMALTATDRAPGSRVRLAFPLQTQPMCVQSASASNLLICHLVTNTMATAGCHAAYPCGAFKNRLSVSAADNEDDDESLPGDDATFEPGKEVEQALRMLESGQQLPPQTVLPASPCTGCKFAMCLRRLSMTVSECILQPWGSRDIMCCSA